MESAGKLKVMILIDWYLPGYRAGGPVQSVSNLVRAMKDQFDFYVLTGCRDHLSDQPYEGVKFNEWMEGPFGEQVCYLTDENQTKKIIKARIGEIKPDTIYMNSMYSLPFTIRPMQISRWLLKQEIRLVLAPRGMLAEGSLETRTQKKKLFLRMFKWRGWHHRLIWHASGQHEKEDIKKIFARRLPIHVIGNFPAVPEEAPASIEKKSGEIRLASVARIVPVKNQAFIPRILKSCRKKISLSIYGPVEDAGYWEEVQQELDALPENISWKYEGEIPSVKVREALKKHHAFLLPTKGENFGHAIFEALAASRPVIISDQTPWRQLSAEKAGFDLPLMQPERFAEAIDMLAGMDQSQFDEWLAGSLNVAGKFPVDELKDKYIGLFE